MADAKPARLIGKLTAALSAHKTEVFDLTARVAELELISSSRGAAIEELDATLESVRADRDRLGARLFDEQRATMKRADDDSLMLARANRVIGHPPAAAALVADPPSYVAKLLANHEAEVAALQARISGLAEREAELDAKEVKLRALVAGVEERMRAREREEASAILNRRAMAGAVPGKLSR